jgi:endo-beta-N-acetylglucosaminidase D
MSSYVKEMDISTIVSKRPLTILPFHTFFNAGSGRHCYFLGQRSKVSEASRTKGYNSLRDYDLPYQDKTLDPSMNGEEVTANICYEDSWVGGSCLKLKCLSK